MLFFLPQWGAAINAFVVRKIFYFPLIVVLIPVAILTFLSFTFSDSSHPLGCCKNCGYDLRGSTGVTCSECGTEITRIGPS